MVMYRITRKRSVSRGRLSATLPLALLASLALASCTAANTPEISIAQANAQIERGTSLLTGDRIRVNVFDEPSLTGEFQVGAGGEIALPLIEPVQATGRTEAQLAADISQSLVKGGYVLNPRVSVDLLELRPIYILGEVNNPGEYPYSSDMTFLQAVAKAGGFTARANKKGVILQRREWGSGRLVRLTEIPLVIAPGDTLIVEESFF